MSVKVKINHKVLKFDLPLIVGALAFEIAAIGSGSHAASLMEDNCDARNGWHIICILLGLAGISVAVYYLVFAIKQRRFNSLIAAIIITVTSVVMAFAAWFSSVFCITF